MDFRLFHLEVEMKTEDKAVFGLSTKEFAALNKVQPEAVRNQFYKHGEYFGAVPCRLRNGRLIWPISNVTTVGATENGN